MAKRANNLTEEIAVQGPMVKTRISEKRQKKFLKAYESAGYNVSKACQKSGITRATLSEWKKSDQEFASKMWEIEESIADFVESQMLKQIRNNNPAMIMWFLETKGKNRGYTRKFEVENNLKIELSTEQIDAMVEAHSLAIRDDKGKLKMPPLRLNAGKRNNDRNGDNGNKPIDTEYRKTNKRNKKAEPESTGTADTGSEVPGT